MKLVLLRHGQSTWNLENRFTGWVDVDLSDQGFKEAVQAGQLLKAEGYAFDIAFTSVLKRAIRTLWIAMSEMDMMWLPVTGNWRLNERHYGGLQGLDKAETVSKHGEAQVKIWRRSFDIPPPSLSLDEAKKVVAGPQYRELWNNPPLAESLKDTALRVLPYWNQVIVPRLKSGETVLICAHGNSLRALVKHLDHISDKDITELNIPTGIPLEYELDKKLKPVSHRYLGDPEAAKKAAEAVANQIKQK